MRPTSRVALLFSLISLTVAGTLEIGNSVPKPAAAIPCLVNVSAVPNGTEENAAYFAGMLFPQPKNKVNAALSYLTDELESLKTLPEVPEAEPINASLIRPVTLAASH